MYYMVEEIGGGFAPEVVETAGILPAEYTELLAPLVGMVAWDFVLLAGTAALMFFLIQGRLDAYGRTMNLLLWTKPRSRIAEIPALPSMHRPNIPAMVGVPSRWTPVERY